MSIWNPWHGCHKISPGCANCYVYRGDAKHGHDSTVVYKTADFDIPLKLTRKKTYKLTPDKIVYTCFTSDFFVEEADAWRAEAWQMMRLRSDLHFLFVTKRIHRFKECIPHDWGEGYENVTICCTVENQAMADYRLPLFNAAPIKHKEIVCEPLLGPIHLLPYLTDEIKAITLGGESGNEARVCDYEWVLDIRRQCIEKQVKFHFKQTGAQLLKDGKLYRIARQFQHSQAKKACIDV